MTAQMTKADREALAQLVRRRERVAKTEAAQRSAELLADFEQTISARFSFDDDAVWEKAYADAERVVAQAQAVVAKRCEEMGIPKEFSPSLDIHWYRQGQNAVKERRSELRGVARARAAALEKAAKAAIERASLDVQTKLLAGGLDSEEARAFLESMPTIEALMPPLSMVEVESMPTSKRRRLAPPDEALADLEDVELAAELAEVMR